MAAIFTFLLFLSYTGLVVQAVSIQIGRQKGRPNDDFLLQRDTDDCRRRRPVVASGCREYNATFKRGCWCQCGRPSGKYTFFEPRNSCVKVADAHRLSGCDSLFIDETVDDLLKFFPASGIHQKTINVPANQICSLYYGGKIYVQFLVCDGSWKEIPSQLAIDGLEVTPGWSTNHLYVRSKSGETFFANNTGRIFRMAVQCRSLHEVNVRADRSSCVMFKVEGRISCPIPQKNPSEPSATLPQPASGPIPLTTTTPPPRITPTEKLTRTSYKEIFKNPTSTTNEVPD